MVPWSVDDGRKWMTVVAKVTYAIHSRGVAQLCEPRPLVESDLIPFKAHGEALVTGRVRRSVEPRLLGFAVARGRRIYFQRRAILLPVDPAEDGRSAPLDALEEDVLVDADDPRTTARFGAGNALPRPDGGTWSVSSSLDVSSLQRAPREQWTPRFLGGERIRAIGFETHPSLDVRLPALVAAASVKTTGRHYAHLPLTGDTLTLDADDGTVSVVFRGAIESAQVTEPATVHATLVPSDDLHATIGAPLPWRRPRRVPASPVVDPLVLVNASGIEAWATRWRVAPDVRRRVIIAKATFEVPAAGGLAVLAEKQEPLCPDRLDGTGDAAELEVAGDFAPVKPSAEVIIRASARPAQSSPVSVVAVSGAVEAGVVAMGSRHWTAQGVPSSPGAFESLPIRWRHAFGGISVPGNPAGSGADKGTPPPRIERPGALMRTSADRPEPACLAPISPTWEPRRSKLGTFDERWADERWPCPPEDFDPRHHQAAPPELRSENLSEAAELRIEGVLDGGAAITATLPGIRPRVLAWTDQGMHEVPMRLDTITFDVDARRLLVLWRGSYPAATGGWERVLVMRDSVDARLSPRMLVALGLTDAQDHWRDRVIHDDPELDRAVDVATVLKRRSARLLEGAPSNAELGQRTPVSRAAVERLVASGESLRGFDFSGAMLEGIDFSGRDLQGAIFRHADLQGARFDRAKLCGAVLTAVRAEAARFQKADLSRADLSRARLTNASFESAKLDRTTFARATLAGTTWNGATGVGPTFVEACLDGATGERANLSKADFTDASLKAAAFNDANLEQGRFQETDASGASFDRATLTDARFELAACKGASFQGVSADNSSWEGSDLEDCDFSDAVLMHAIFGGAALNGARLERAMAQSASLRAATLAGADLRGADFRDGSFEGAVLDGADARDASFHGCDFTDASLKATRLEGALLSSLKPPRR